MAGSTAGFGSSIYMPLLFCFPALAPLLRPLAAVFPDSRLRRLRKARMVLMNTTFHLIDRQRIFMADQVCQHVDVESIACASPPVLHGCCNE